MGWDLRVNCIQVASAALDVYSEEPPPASSRELLQHPRLVCTPHLGASTEEAQVCGVSVVCTCFMRGGGGEREGQGFLITGAEGGTDFFGSYIEM